MTRPFTPLSDADWPAEIADLHAGFAGQLNVYRLMAHHPDLLRAWTGLRAHIVQQTALGPVRAEVVILRLAHRLDCAYEWNQHVLRGLKQGLAQDRIAGLRGDCAQMAAQDAILCRAVDALLDQSRLSVSQMQALEASVGRHGVLDLMATVGMYLTLGFLLNSVSAPLEPEIAAELDRRAPELRFDALQ